MENLNGRIRVLTDIAAALGAGALTIDLKPPNSGIVWRILWAYCYQVSGGARNLVWTFITPEDGATDLFPAAACNDYQGFLLGENNANRIVSAEWWATYSRYPQAYMTATGAGDDLYIRAVVIEYLGAESTS
jgi:hypothetical protein